MVYQMRFKVGDLVKIDLLLQDGEEKKSVFDYGIILRTMTEREFYGLRVKYVVAVENLYEVFWINNNEKIGEDGIRTIENEKDLILVSGCVS